MFENFMFSVNAILPLVLIVLLGYFLKRKKIINEKFFSYGSKFCFYVALPASLFKSAYTADFNKIDWKFIGYCLGFTSIIFIIMLFCTKLFCPEDKQRGVIIQASFRSNYAYIGIPLAGMLFGGDTEIASLMAAFSIPLYNMLSIVALTIFVKKEDGNKKGFIDCIKGIIKNPLIISIFIAIVLNLLLHGISSLTAKNGFDLINSRWIPSLKDGDNSYFAFISTTVVYIAKLATPLSLFVIGGQFEFASVKKLAKPIIITVSLRLIIVPVIALLVATLLFNFNGPEYATMIALFGTPAAVASAIMAKEMDNDGELANQIVVWSTICSAFTLFAIIFVVNALGYLS